MGSVEPQLSSPVTRMLGLLLHRRPVIPFIITVWAAAFTWADRDNPNLRTDFDGDYLWHAGHAVWRGLDPYVAVQHAVEKGTLHYPLYYPGTAAVFMAP